jgi:hypothetical protein
MSELEFTKRAYSDPIYGSSEKLPSLNFRGFKWFQQDADGKVIDPYKLLLEELGTECETAERINQAGAASNAYLSLQFEDLQPEVRRNLQRGLSRYCELDTLAMVLVLQAWVFH